MKRPRPRRLFRRPRPDAPNYVPLVAALVERARAAGLIRPGELNRVYIYHDPDCAALLGGVCGCQPSVELVELADPARN